jgi:hypothetical protein
MARPDCPRCGSDLITAAPTDSPSEWVEELRGGNVRARSVAGRSSWLCRACGHRWDPLPDSHELSADLGEEHAPSERSALREHAELLQLQPERSARSSPHANLRSTPQPPDVRRRRGLVGAAMAVMAVAVVVFIALLPTTSIPDVEVPEASGPPAPVFESGRASPPPPAPERRGLRAVLHVDQLCWVRVVADGEVVASITLAPGDAVVYRAKRDLQLRLGNGGGVNLRVNGERVPTGSPGEVVVLDLAWQQGEVLIERG